MELSGNLYLTADGRATEGPNVFGRAWLDYEEKRYYTEGFSDDKSPETPVTRLIHGIYSMFADQALKVLRNRIYTSYPATALCRATVAVGAKRLADQVSWEPSSSQVLLDGGWCPVKNSGLDSTVAAANEKSRLARTLDLALSVKIDSERFKSSRRVAALAIGPDGQELGAAVNTNAVNKIQHAEMNLLWILKYGGHTPILPGTIIYVSLRPCKMCAAAIVHCSSDPSQVSVVYAEEDAGPLSQNTELDRCGMIKRGTEV